MASARPVKCCDVPFSRSFRAHRLGSRAAVTPDRRIATRQISLVGNDFGQEPYCSVLFGTRIAQLIFSCREAETSWPHMPVPHASWHEARLAFLPGQQLDGPPLSLREKARVRAVGEEDSCVLWRDL